MQIPAREPVVAPAAVKTSENTGLVVASGSAVRVSSRPDDDQPPFPVSFDRIKVSNIRPLNALLVVPTLHAGAADTSVVDLVGILTKAGHHAIVLSGGGRLEADISKNGGEFIRANVATKNPFAMLRNAMTISRIARERKCDVIHAHGRAPGWSAFIAAKLTRLPFLTSWYKGFREQNFLKRLYNSVMIRGDRIVAASDQIAELICDRYGIGSERIDVVPVAVDLDRFDPAQVSAERIETMRRSWGLARNARVILIVGRMIRRKGHHLVVQAAHRLKAMGLRDFTCVFVGEDQGRSHYSGELWDLVLATNTADVVRLPGEVEDMPAAYAAASIVVSAATQPEGLQRAILEAQAMARPVVASDLGAGPEILLAPPAVAEDRMTGLRFSTGDSAALAAAIIRMFSMPDAVRQTIGARGREWVVNHFNPPLVSELTLKLYDDVARSRKPA